MRVKTRSFALARGDERIVLMVEGCHLRHHLPVLACRLHIIIGGEEHRWQHTGAEVSTEIARSSDQVRLMKAENLRLRNDDLEVKVALQQTHATLLKLGAEALQHVQ